VSREAFFELAARILGRFGVYSGLWFLDAQEVRAAQ
jgi:hypothetical protein